MCNTWASEPWGHLYSTSSALPVRFGAFQEDEGFTSVGSVLEKAAHQETVTLEAAPNCSATPKHSFCHQDEVAGAIFWRTTCHRRGKCEVEGKDCSHTAGVVEQAKAWMAQARMAQALYHIGAPRSHKHQLRGLLGLWGHLDREEIPELGVGLS